MLIILYAGITSALGLYFLARSAEKVGGRNASFSSLSKLTWPKLGIFFDAAIAIKCFGVAISYLIILGDLMPQVYLYALCLFLFNYTNIDMWGLWLFLR